MSAINPTPQESLSSAGSERPCASGVPGSAVEPRPANAALRFCSLISSCLAGAIRSGVPTSSARQRARGQRVTDLEKEQPVRRCRRPWLHLFGRHRCLPCDLRAATRARQPLGQYYCPNGPCQILPCRTRLVHAGLSEIFRFIAAVTAGRQERLPTPILPRNPIAPMGPLGPLGSQDGFAL